MPTRFPRPSYSTLGPCLGMILALIGGATATADAQRAGGSIGVSLTILESVTTHPLEVTGFRVERDGRATVEITASTTGSISHLVMARVSSSANGFQPIEQAPVLVGGNPDGEVPALRDVGAQHMTHRVDVGRASPGAEPRDVQLRIEYLVVAGT